MTHEARILVMAVMAVCPAVLFAMPTQQELKKAQPLVAELMAPTMDDFKAKKKTAADVADAAVKYAGEAETEAAKFMLYRSSIPYFVKGEAYDKAADAVEQLKANVKDVPPSVVEEIISKATVRANKEKAPRLFELYQQAKTQAEAEKDVDEIRKKSASTTNRRKLAEALATAGNWSEALKEFASLRNDVALIAKKERDGNGKSYELGEFWWAYEPVYENAEDTFKIHAAAHYRKALAAGEITGLKKNIVEQRIAKYGAIPAAGGQGTGTSPRTPAATGLYCVIDLSGGPDAKKYPVSYLNDMPRGGWSDEYKTTKLVLRRIEPGKPVVCGEGAQQKRVSIDAAYYVGVFEVTQGQWEKIMGTRPSYLRGKRYALRPVEQVSYDMIRGRERGCEWPDSNQVDADSFIGCLRARTGMDFDLPTNGQWEYACCAGVGTDYNNGGKCTDYEKNPAMNVVGRYLYNGGWNEEKWGKFEFNKISKTLDRECGPENGTAVVGSYAPNKWGLYDMHGNVFEWCLDRKGEPEGGQIRRAVRGGWWVDKAAECCTFVYKSDRSNHAALWHGLRLCLPLVDGAAASAPAATTPSTGSIELKTGGNSPFAANGNVATLTLKSGVKLEFVKCPSGWVKVVDDYERNSTRKVKITRPFWIMKRCLWKDDVQKEVQLRDSYCENGVQIYPAFSRIEGFCSNLTDDLKSVIPAGYVVRLPSIAEWEYAYHAGSEDPDDEPFGSLLCRHDVNLFNRHGGKTPVNKWGLCDFHVLEKVLDRVNPQSVNVFEKETSRVARLPDSKLNDDLFYWEDDLTATANLVRLASWHKLRIANDKTFASVRLVIGPDLVSEWKAKNAKK